jgi:hypothetical protein
VTSWLSMLKSPSLTFANTKSILAPTPAVLPNAASRAVIAFSYLISSEFHRFDDMRQLTLSPILHMYIALDLSNSEISLSPWFSSASFNFVAISSKCVLFFSSSDLIRSDRSELMERRYGAISIGQHCISLQYCKEGRTIFLDSFPE